MAGREESHSGDWLSPGAEAVLSHSLFLELTGVLQLHRAGNKTHLSALLHQTADPPVIIILLLKEHVRAHTHTHTYTHTHTNRHTHTHTHTNRHTNLNNAIPKYIWTVHSSSKYVFKYEYGPL